MSYEALARRWRPRRFEDMLGQQHVLRALSNALDHDRLHHAYLFTGTRGVGKTTIARIFAKSLNCEKGVSSTPCDECSACKQVDEGRFLDLIEVDAASRTGVDDTRELLDNVAYAPSSGRYKVYLIDEVHMFSKSSFNALLKTLEEPPPHVKFLLATTDPQKLPITVLSRCLQFNLKEMPDQLLRPYLATLLDNEKVKYDELAVAHVAQAADGSVRDALSLLDQAIAYGQGEIKSAEVEAMLGRFSPSRLYDILDTIIADKPDQAFKQVDELAAYVPDYSYVLGELLSLLHQIATVQTIGNIQEGSVHDESRLTAFAKDIAPQDVQLWYQIGLTGRRDMPYAPNQRQALEMILIRMLAFKPFAEASVAQPAQAAVQTSPGSAANAVTAAPANPVTRQSAPRQTPQAAAPATAANVTTQAINTKAATTKAATTEAQGKQAPARVSTDHVKKDRSSKDEASKAQASKDKVAPQPQLPPAQLKWKPGQWSQILAEVGISGMPLQLGRNCILHSAKNDQLHLHLDPEYDSLGSPRSKARLQEKLSLYAQGEVQLKVSIPADRPQGTPAMLEKLAEQEKLNEARSAIEEDPVVAEIVAKFDAEVSTGSIRPLDDQPDS